MKSLIIVNPADCIGCRTCEVACGRSPFRTGVECRYLLPRLKVQRLDSISAPVMCHQCENALVLALVPWGADDGRAGGAGKFCPLYWLSELRQCVPVWNDHHSVIAGDTRQQIVKCDLCEQREEGPACVESCPTQALQLLTERELRRVRQQRIVASGENPL